MGGRFQQAHRLGTLYNELAILSRYGLVIIHEVGYLPFQADTANLFFQARLQQVRTRVSDFDLNPAVWAMGGGFGGPIIAAAMVGRLGYHAEVHNLSGNSYQTGERNLDTLTSKKPENKTQ